MSSGKHDTTKIDGWVEVIVRDKDGKIKAYIGPKQEEIDDPPGEPILSSAPGTFQDYYWLRNIITNAGIASIIRLIFSGLTDTKFGYLAIGSGTTTESATDTALVQEIKRKAATITQTTTSISGDTAQVSATFSSSDGLTGTANVCEAGIFNASTGGTMLARKTFTCVSLNWDAGDSITINYYVQMSR
ncbi:MAG: hypothetical protein DSO07_05130 [Thermoproteota archaeon]|nr:MAG: hypothetical protein DSO07_05130 [Candidatus Korarchaeota archaeon]